MWEKALVRELKSREHKYAASYNTLLKSLDAYEFLCSQNHNYRPPVDSDCKHKIMWALKAMTATVMENRKDKKDVFDFLVSAGMLTTDVQNRSAFEIAFKNLLRVKRLRFARSKDYKSAEWPLGYYLDDEFYLNYDHKSYVNGLLKS